MAGGFPHPPYKLVTYVCAALGGYHWSLRHFDLKTSTDFDDYGLKTSVVLSASV